MQPDGKYAELNDLLSRLCDVELEQPGWERLETLLLDDPDAQEYYSRFMALDVDLAWRAAERTAGLPLELATADQERDIGPASAGEEIELPHASFPSLSRFPSLSTNHYSPSTNFVGGPVFSYMVATVILCVMLLSAWAYKITRHQQQIVEVPSKSTPAYAESDFVFVGQITGMTKCRWSDPRTEAYAGSSVPLGRKYALSSGLIEITYDSGAKVILEGPCTYEVESGTGGYLSLGKLAARVEVDRGKSSGFKIQGPISTSLAISRQSLATNSNPQSLTPNPSSVFVVRTPTAIVTDLGTEFGVEVDEKGNTTSHVFRGSVKIQTVGDNDSRSADGNELGRNEKASIVLLENESALVESHDGKSSITRSAVAKVPVFVLEFPLPKAAEETISYSELVLSLKPAVYYRMERSKDGKDGNLVFDWAGGNHHGVLHLGNEYAGSPYMPGRFGDSLRLRGRPVGDHVVVAEYPKSINGQLTVSAWVKAMNRPMWAMIAGDWSADWPQVLGQFRLGLRRYDGDLAASIIQSDKKRIEVREGKECQFPLFVWQHVAMVADGASLRLYRNGDEVASAPCSGVFARPNRAAMAIGCRINEPSEPPFKYFWNGRIDELAVFNHALSADAIRRLACFTGASTKSSVRQKSQIPSKINSHQERR